MGIWSWFSSKPAPEPEKPKKKKICCACPETKASGQARLLCDGGQGRRCRRRRAARVALLCWYALLVHSGHSSLPWPQKERDECTLTHGPEAPQCQELIEAHKACLRAEGFNVGAACSASGNACAAVEAVPLLFRHSLRSCKTLNNQHPWSLQPLPSLQV